MPDPAADKPRRRWPRVLLALGGLLLLIGLGVGFAVWQGFASVPDIYLRERLTGQERLDAIAGVERKVASFQSSLGEAVAQRRKASTRRKPAAATQEPTQQPATQPAAEVPIDPVRLTFTGPELDTYFDNWLRSAGHLEAMSAHLKEPRLLLDEGRLVLAGQSPQLNNAVISIYFLPELSDNGRVRLRLESAYAGRMPLPDSAFSGLRDAAAGGLANDVADATAGFSDDGSVNDATVTMAMNDQIRKLVAGEPVEDLVIFPRLLDFGVVPCRLVEADVPGDRLTMGVVPMRREGIEALVDRLNAAE
jgi:hypothetical protein